jgi:hypothetical protein
MDTTSPEEKKARGVEDTRKPPEPVDWDESWSRFGGSSSENIKRKSAKDTIILERWNKIIK